MKQGKNKEINMVKNVLLVEVLCEKNFKKLLKANLLRSYPIEF
jgi:hypothetical protein